MTGCKLLSYDELKSNASRRPPIKSGIYFLFDGGEIVYIGRGIDIDARIQAHKKKDYGSWAWVACPTREQERLERAYLDQFLPRLNRDFYTEVARRAAGYFSENVPGGFKRRIRRGRVTPRGCYWRGEMLWGRLILHGKEHRMTLRTSDPKEAVRRRTKWADDITRNSLTNDGTRHHQKEDREVSVTALES